MKNPFFTLAVGKKNIFQSPIFSDFERFESGNSVIFLKNFEVKGNFHFHFFGTVSTKIDCCEKIETDNFINEPEKCLDKIKGTFSLVRLDKTAYEVKIVTDPLSLLSVFIYKTDNFLIVSNSIFELAKLIKKPEFDSDSLTGFLLFNYCLFEKTNLKGVKKLEGGKIISIDSNLNFIEKQYFSLEELTSSEKKTTNDAEILSQSLAKILENYGKDKFSLALTDGFDSRTLLSVFKQTKQPLTSFTFGNAGSEMFGIVKQLSENAKISNSFYEPDKNFENSFDSFWKKTFFETNGAFSAYRLFRAWAIEKELKSVPNIVFGFGGGEFIRGLIVDKLMFSESVSKAILKDKNGFSEVSQAKLNSLFLKPEFLKDQIKNIENNFEWLLKKDFSDDKTRLLGITQNIFSSHFGADIFYCFQRGQVFIPYFDIDFLKAVFSLKDNLLTVEPFSKSFSQKIRSHKIYCEIIANFEKSLLSVELGRGYKPIDLFNKNYPKIAFKYLKAKFQDQNEVPPYSMNNGFTKALTNQLEEVQPFLEDEIDFDKLFEALFKIKSGTNLTFLPYTQILNFGLQKKAFRK